MLQGEIKWFNNKKGYGFIRPDQSDKDVFVHITALEKSGIRNISDGQKVSFEIISDRGKQSASNIQLLH